MSEDKSNFGIKATGDAINWRSINSSRNEDPVITDLMKEGMTFINNNNQIQHIKENNSLDFNTLIYNFNIFLKDNKLPIIFTNNEKNIENIDKSKNKQKKLTSKELILQKIKDENEKKDIDKFIKSIKLNNYFPISNKNEKEAFILIIYWTIILIKNKKDKTIDISIYMNCAISLYRCINDSTSFLSEDIFNKSNELLIELEKIIDKKYNKSTHDLISTNVNLISKSFWDVEKPRPVMLYSEQKNVISKLMSSLETNTPMLLFYKVPPANGKTILSAILGKSISQYNKKNIDTPCNQNKILLYICYNSIVREEVANLCTTHNVDIKYWFARTQIDKVDGKIKTLLRPYKTCYPDWNVKVQKSNKESKLDNLSKAKRYSEDLNVQLMYFLNETRRNSEKHREIENFNEATNVPEMIISDLDSAYKLLKQFPDIFIPYFDEAFAAYDLKITSKIFSVLPKISILISATLAEPQELPIFMNDFKKRHNLNDNKFLHLVKTDTQHISCTFINSDGQLFAPHNSIKNIENMEKFLNLLENEPLIKRAYSPDIVLDMSRKLDNLLEDELKFDLTFPFIGMITQESLRSYGIKILKYIFNQRRQDLLDILNTKIVTRIKDLSIKNMFTKNAIFYQKAKTLHVASSNNFNLHLQEISKEFLEKSPKVADIIDLYNKEYEVLNNELQSLIKNGKKDDEYQRNQVQQELNNLRLKWPSEFILNSKVHANKNGNLSILTNPNIEIFGKLEDMESLNDIDSKLYFSGIGIYHPETFSSARMNLFLQNKDKYKFILSTPSIVYGTNISLSIIDIDESFSEETTKNMLYQLIGRAGRRNKSDSATIIFRDNNMINKILEENTINIEAVKIESDYQDLITVMN
jgi:hypothetical protein